MSFTTIAATTLGLADGDQSPTPVSGTVRITPRHPAGTIEAGGVIATGPVIVTITGGAFPSTAVPAREDSTALVEFHLYTADGPVRMPDTEIPLAPGATINLHDHLPAGVDPATGRGLARGQAGPGITSITTRNGRVIIEWEGGDDVSIPVPGAEYVDTRVSTVRNYTDATKVDVTDARLPRHAADDEILAQVQDQDGRSTWLAARTSDGGPTDWSERIIRDRIGVHAQPAHGYLFALLDAQGQMTDLTLRSTDGRFTDEVVDGLAARIRDRMPPPTMYVDAPYTPGTTVMPVRAKTDALAGWGSSTISGISGQLESMAQAHGMSWHAGGQGGEWVEHTAARMNAIPARLAFPDNTIPASGSVVVTSENLPPKASLRPYTGIVAGIAGTLSSTDTELTFTRTSAGDPAPVAPGAEFVSDLGIEHRSDTLILNVGKNNLAHGNPDRHDPAAVAAKTMRMVEYHAALHKRVLVLGQFVNTGTPAVSAVRDRIYEADAILSRELGTLFFDTHAWVTSPQYWVDVESEPTAADLDEQALGNKPHTGSLDNGHFNTVGYMAYRKPIEAAMSSLGWLS